MTAPSQGVFDAAIPLAGTVPDQISHRVALRREAMERAGVAGGILIADRRGPAWHSHAAVLDARLVAREVVRHQGVFWGAIGVNPTRISETVRQIRAAVSDGFVAVHTVPHAFGLAPDDASWYPVYAACSELDLPVLVELGIHRSVGVRVRSVGVPIALDGVACDFPSLKMIGLGPWPWTEEAISVSYKHANVYLAVGGDDPGAADPALVRYADSWGSEKVVFATGGSPIEDAVNRVRGFALRPEAARRCLEQNARQLFAMGEASH